VPELDAALLTEAEWGTSRELVMGHRGRYSLQVGT
jgi:hypothetical protein